MPLYNRAMSTTKLTEGNPSKNDSFLKSEVFRENIGVCAAFPSRQASRNSSKGLDETVRDGVAIELAIGFHPLFCLRNYLTGSNSI